MATEYGAREFTFGPIEWHPSRQSAEAVIHKFYGFTLVAREVSEPRIVSIRA